MLTLLGPILHQIICFGMCMKVDNAVVSPSIKPLPPEIDKKKVVEAGVLVLQYTPLTLALNEIRFQQQQQNRKNNNPYPLKILIESSFRWFSFICKNEKIKIKGK